MKRATVIKIENDIVSLKFSNNTIRKFFLDNFAKTPFIDQEVEILNNGLIVEVEKEKNDKNKTPNKSLQILSIVMLIAYVVLLIVLVNKNVILYSDEATTLVVGCYTFITLCMFCLSTFYVNSKVINTIFKVLIAIVIIAYALYILVYIFTIIWLFVACASCA